jgi:rubrerythrin
MSIALQAEREAIRRYSQLAAAMHAGSNDSAAALFERMVLEEQEHERLLLEWMAQEGIAENPGIGPISWRDPNVSTTYDAEARDPYYSSPYRALAFAVHNEEIAFRFYTHVAAESDSQVVRDYAETLAREELGHAALLRAERRYAYHAERKASNTEARLDPKAIHHESDLLALAIHIDQHLVDEMQALAANSAEITALARTTQQQLLDYKNRLDTRIAPGEAVHQYLQQRDRYNAELEKISSSPEARIKQLCACADRSFALYDSIVAATSNETIMLSAQQLSAAALNRIGILKQVYQDAYLASD